MRTSSIAGLPIIIAVLLLFSGCVEIDGQRITWFFDEAKDELKLLIFYDGIHDSGTIEYGEGTEQVPKFVADGDIMLMDWFFYLDMNKLREDSQSRKSTPLEKEWYRLLTAVKSQPVGYYREPDGHIGAAQLLTIPNASQFIRDLNRLISRQILEEGFKDEYLIPRTIERLKMSARRNEAWIELDGQSILAGMPVHPGEWASVKRRFFESLFELYLACREGRKQCKSVDSARLFVQAFSSALVSYMDLGDYVRIAVGRPSVSITARLWIRDEYEPSLEKVLMKTVKVNLDEELTKAALGNKTKRSEAISAVLNWGPPEEKARALINLAENDNEDQRATAIKYLQSLSEQWNAAQRMVEAPAEGEGEEYLAAWKDWYTQMKRYPYWENTGYLAAPASPEEQEVD